MRTAREITMRFQDMHDLRIPAGTSARWIKGGTGGYAIAPSSAHLESKTAALFKHDATYYYIWVDAKDLTP